MEEVTASAQSLAGMAQTLQAVVAQFKLSEETGGGTRLPLEALSAAQTLGDGHRRLEAGLSLKTTRGGSRRER